MVIKRYLYKQWYKSPDLPNLTFHIISHTTVYDYDVIVIINRDKKSTLTLYNRVRRLCNLWFNTFLLTLRMSQGRLVPVHNEKIPQPTSFRAPRERSVCNKTIKYYLLCKIFICTFYIYEVTSSTFSQSHIIIYNWRYSV